MSACLVLAGAAHALPTLTKSYSPTTFSGGGTTTLTFTLTSPAGDPAVSNVGFDDDLPSGLRVANPASVGGTCTNAAAATQAFAGDDFIGVVGLNVPAGPASCTVTVNITNAPGAFNSSCVGDPVAFTNGTDNVPVPSLQNVLKNITNSCVVVLGGPEPEERATPVPTLSSMMLLAMLLVVGIAGAVAVRRTKS